MKLSDLGATPAMKAATAKLSHQTSMVTVAAAKAPKMDLGVLGISIGQKQSKGITSRTGMAEGQLNEAMQGEAAYELLDHLFTHVGDHLPTRKRAGSGSTVHNFDKAGCMNQALEICRMWHVDAKSEQANKVLHQISMLRNRIESTALQSHSIREAGEGLRALNFTPLPGAQAVIKAADDFEEYAEEVMSNCSMIENLVDAIDSVWNLATSENKEKAVYARAALKQLGLPYYEIQ